MTVKTPAASRDIPPPSAIAAMTESNDPPGATSIGQTDWPSAVALSGAETGMPAIVKARRNALPIRSACTGAANAAAKPATPALTPTARSTRVALVTVTTVVGDGHVGDTAR